MLAAGLSGCTSGARAQIYSAVQRDNGAFAPFEIADGLYYVGTSDIAVYALRTSAGLVVIDGGYETTAPRVLANLRTLGFQPSDVKVLLNTHAHMDHAAGLAELKRATGAQLFVSERDADEVETGGRGDFYLGDWMTYPPAHVDRRLRDLEEVRLGETVLTAHVTAGHTKGCTSWAFDVFVDGVARRALVICSTSTLTYRLRDNAQYPEIAADFARTFATLRSLRCEVFLGAHGKFFRLREKRARQIAGGASPFVDPEGCASFIDREERAFRRRLGE
jgi:metallo-beta-lactamase class B